MGVHRKYVAAVRPLVRNDPSSGPPGRSIRRVARLSKRPSGIVQMDRDSDGSDSVYTSVTASSDRSQHRPVDLFNLDDIAPDSTPLTLSPIEAEVVNTPLGKEIVNPGWDHYPTVQMKAISPELIAQCRPLELPKTVRSMRAVTVPPPPFRKVSK